MTHKIPYTLALLLGTSVSEAQQRTVTTPTSTAKPIAEPEQARVEPVILARS